MGDESMEIMRKIEASKTDGRDKPEAEVSTSLLPLSVLSHP